MDESLFILLAKLKADRLRLAREQCRAAADQLDLFAPPRVATTHGSPPRLPNRSIAARWFSSQPESPA